MYPIVNYQQKNLLGHLWDHFKRKYASSIYEQQRCISAFISVLLLFADLGTNLPDSS